MLYLEPWVGAKTCIPGAMGGCYDLYTWSHGWVAGAMNPKPGAMGGCYIWSHGWVLRPVYLEPWVGAMTCIPGAMGGCDDPWKSQVFADDARLVLVPLVIAN